MHQAIACQCKSLFLYSRSLRNLNLEQGTNDSIFPIEDSTIPLQYGSVKEARYVSSAEQCFRI